MNVYERFPERLRRNEFHHGLRAFMEFEDSAWPTLPPPWSSGWVRFREWIALTVMSELNPAPRPGTDPSV